MDVREELRDQVESFQLLVGASPKQRMKCGAVAYDGKLCLSFASAMAENRLPEYFFRFLEKQGIPVELESNGISDREHDKGRYPVVGGDKNKIKRAVRLFYISLAVVSVLAGAINLATYRQIPFKWAFLTWGAAAYGGDDAAVFRHASRQYVRDPGAAMPGNPGDPAAGRHDDGAARLVRGLRDPLCGAV